MSSYEVWPLDYFSYMRIQCNSVLHTQVTLINKSIALVDLHEHHPKHNTVVLVAGAKLKKAPCEYIKDCSPLLIAA